MAARRAFQMIALRAEIGELYGQGAERFFRLNQDGFGSGGALVGAGTPFGISLRFGAQRLSFCAEALKCGCGVGCEALLALAVLFQLDASVIKLGHSGLG